MNLDDLEKLAKAAKHGKPRLVIDDIDKAFIAACSPDVVLALIAVAKAAVAASNSPNTTTETLDLWAAVDALMRGEDQSGGRAGQ